MSRQPGVRALAALVAVAALVGGVTACSSGSHSETTATASYGASATEVAFAQGMIPHHEQAVEMADMALDPEAQASPQVKALAEQIQAAQGPEIQEMSAWLAEWGAPSSMPTTGGDMSGMDHSGHDMGGMTMSGMMTSEDMQALADSRGAAFDTMWLEMMIAHHEGAVSMAEQVNADSTDPEVTALADAVIEGQQKEIAQMKKMLAQS